MAEIKNLKSIAEIYKSDKIEHGYIQKYESYFEKIRDEKLKILEIGIADGKSLLTWSDYFKNSIIIGIDIHKINIVEKNLDRNNIEVHRGSQSDIAWAFRSCMRNGLEADFGSFFATLLTPFFATEVSFCL